MHDERGVRVDRVAAAGAHLEVEVGAGHVAGGADGPDDLACADLLALADAEAALVAVPDLGAVIEGHHGLVAVGAVVADGGDDAVRDRHDRLALVAVEVEARVVARPEAVVAELGGGDRRADREHPLVEGDLLRLRLGQLGELGQRGVALLGHRLGLRDQVGIRCIGQGVAAGVTRDGGASLEEVAAGLSAVATQRVRRGEPGLGGGRELGLRHRHGAAGGHRECGDTEQDRDRRQAPEERAARAAVLVGPAATGTVRSGHGSRDLGGRRRRAALAATIRSVVAHVVVALPGSGGDWVRSTTR